MRRSLTFGVFLTVVATLLVSTGQAVPIGRPVSLDITITQGASTVVFADNVTIPLADALNGKNYIPIGDLGGGMSKLYLSVQVYDTTADESWFSIYVRAGDPSSPAVPGILPLFDLNGSGMINVSVDDFQFQDSGVPRNLTVSQFQSPIGDNMMSMYMMDSAGWYYDLPQAQAFSIPPKLTHQVSYSHFRDPDPNYMFNGDTGTHMDLGWNNMYSPVDTPCTIIESDAPYNSQTDNSGGAVFEIGLNAYAYDGGEIPEPATLCLVMLGGLLCRRRAL